MPGQRIHHGRTVGVLPDDFPQRLVRFKEESGQRWAEIARRVGTSYLNVRRWRNGVWPHWRHLAALLELAEDLGLAHLFTGWTLGEETRSAGARPPQCGETTGSPAERLRPAVSSDRQGRQGRPLARRPKAPSPPA